MAVNFSQVKVNREGFATIKTPVSASSMMRHALDIEATFNDLLNGAGRKTTINRLLFTTAAAKTISGGIVSTPTLAQHTITSESGTADDVDTIGASNNTFLFVRATAGHVITLKNATGNITVPGGTNLILSGNITALLWCEDGQWSVLGTTLARVNPSGTTDPASGEDALDGYSVGSIWVNTSKKRAWRCVDNTAAAAIWKRITPWRDSWSIRGTDATAVGIGIATPTISGSVLSSSNTATNTYVGIRTAAGPDGIITTTFNLVRLDHDPIIEVYVRTHSGITGGERYWIGLTTADAAASDTAAGIFVGFRYSQATDTGWRPILRNGATQGAGTNIGTLATSTDYKLRIRVDSANARAYFSVNDGAEQLFSTNFPTITTEMGFMCRNTTPTPSGQIYFASAEVGW